MSDTILHHGNTVFLQAVQNLTVAPLMWTLYGDDEYDNIKWEGGGTPPSATEVQAEVNRLLGQLNAIEYKTKRAAAYPSIGDQLDMIYHAGQGGDAFQAAIKAVKDKYPKPE